MKNNHQSIASFVDNRNANKFLFTPGPASLLSENLTGLRPCFGRGDYDYEALEDKVMNALKKISGHQFLVRMQGSASLALEIMALNFLFGRILVVQTGYYSERLSYLANSAKRFLGEVKEVNNISWEEIDLVEGKYDWIFACYTETSYGLKMPIEKLRATANRISAKLMIDATASIGLEQNHDLADSIAYSSCKGLFGLTGAAFIAHHDAPTVEINSFNLNLANHANKMMTGPYHAIASLDKVLQNYGDFREAVLVNKSIFMRKMNAYLTRPPEYQPLLCTHVRCQIKSLDWRAILYAPRSNFAGSIICHLGEAHLGRAANGNILSVLEVKE